MNKRYVIENILVTTLICILMYFLYGISADEISAEVIIINALTQFWLFTLFFVLTWDAKKAVFQALLLTIGICSLNILKLMYLDAELLTNDVNFLNLSNSYVVYDYPLVGCALLVIFFSFAMPLLGFVINIFHRKLNFNKVNVIVMGAMLVFSFSTLVVAKRIYKKEPVRLIDGVKQGLGMHLFISAVSEADVLNRFPKNKSTIFEQKLQEDERLPRLAFKPDIFLWLHESTINPDMYKSFEAFKKLDLFMPDRFTRELGWLRVYTFGGGTWLSEFSVLTGLNHLDFGALSSSVFYNVVPRLNESLVKSLKKHGYYTVAFNPVKVKNHYNAETAYYQLGFDKVVSPSDLGFSPSWRTSDKIVVESLIKIWKENNSIDRPVFIYGLSIAQHGPYNEKKISRIEPKEKNEKEGILFARMTDYWDKLDQLNASMNVLQSTILEQQKRKVILVTFGDHHPNFWYREMNYLKPELNESGLLNADYVTYYKIQDNFTVPKNQSTQGFSSNKTLDITFLPSKLLSAAGLEKSPLFRANQTLYELCEGKLEDCPDRSLVESYKSYIYHKLNVFQNNL